MKKTICLLNIILIIFMTVSCSGGVAKIELDRLTTDSLATSGDNIFISTDEKYEELAGKIKKVVTEKAFPGSVLLATDSQIIYASGTDAFEKDGKEVSLDTTYQLGSLSKTFTATCVLKLIEGGKLSLDDTLGTFLPECEKLKDITVYQLLHMNAGLGDVVNYMDLTFDTRGEDFLAEIEAGTLDSDRLADYFKDIKFVTEPGKKVEYCNTNYILLAMIVEKVTGKSYDEYLRQTIIEPLDLTNTTSGNLDAVTCAYILPETPILFLKSPALLKGAGDVNSNVLDMLHFDRALFSGLIINQDSLQTMFDFKNDYSCGWMKDNTKSNLHTYGNYYWKTNDENTVFHAGRIPGFLTYNIVLNENGERMYLIILFTVDETSADSVTSVSKRMNEILKQF